MAIVPIFQPSERLRGVHQQGMTTQATGEDFGAAKGRGLEALAKGVGTIADVVAKLKAREDETVAKERDNEITDDLDKRLHDPETGFLSKKGKEAVDAWPAFKKDVQKAADKSRKGLTGNQAELLKRPAGARTAETEQTGAKHLDNEKKDWAIQTSERRLEGFLAGAVKAFGDPRAVDVKTLAAIDEIDSLGDLRGWNAERRDSFKRNFVSAAWSGVVRQWLKTDPYEAQSRLGAYGGRIDTKVRKSLEAEVEEGIVSEEAKREFNRIEDQVGSGLIIDFQGVAGPRILGGGDLARSMIQGRSEFRSIPYEEGDELRAGFGSSTITRKDGTIVPVQAGMIVDLDDAQRDLERRLVESQADLSKAIGSGEWRALSPNMQAVLTSVAFDYRHLPDGVVTAARSGDTEAIANAIAALGDEDGGIDRTRRLNEAAIARGRMNAKGRIGLSYAETEHELNKIENERVRDKTRVLLNARYGLQEKQQGAAEREVQSQIYAIIQSGGTPDDVPPELRVKAGQLAMKNLESYYQQRIRRGQPENDELLHYQLERAAARDPQGFARRNLWDDRHRLDDDSFRHFEEIQQLMAKGDKNAVEEALLYHSAYKQMDKQLASMGMTPGRAASAQSLMLAKVYKELKKSCIAYAEQNNGRQPDAAEMQTIVAKQLVPVLQQTPARLPTIRYEDIPEDLRKGIAASLKDEYNGQHPTDKEVAARYSSFVNKFRP